MLFLSNFSRACKQKKMSKFLIYNLNEDNFSGLEMFDAVKLKQFIMLSTYSKDEWMIHSHREDF